MRVLTAALAALLAVLVAFLVGLFAWGRDLPSVSDLDVLEFSGQSRVYDRSGTFVGTFAPSLANGFRVNRRLLKLEQISPFLQRAVVTSEDRRFYEHHGIDFLGVARGLIRSATGDVEGGSTLTQQLVKNTLLADLESARTPERKFKEALLAVQVERQFSKEEILGAYLNVIYWGSGGKSDIVGAATAARAYFDKDASQLGLAESVYLATLIPSPGRYFDYKGYRPLMRSLLDRMVEDGRVTRAQADAAWRVHLQPAGWRVRYDGAGNVVSARLFDKEAKNRNTPPLPPRPHVHFMQTVERDLIARFGRKAVYSGGGLKVYTTMDLQAQQAAERASLDAQLPAGATLGLALVAPESGEVLALVGQKLDGGRSADWNNATQARRQVGSSVKPFLYTLALEQGFKQSDTVLDAPLTGEYQPQNYSGHYTGRPVTLRYALDHSLNLPTVRLAQQVGVSNLEDKLTELGFTPPENAGLSLAIGTLEASPLQMAEAYAAFANGGTYHQPSFLRRVVDAGGAELALPQPASRRVWSPQVAYLGLDMLRGVVNDLGRYEGGLAWRARVPGWDVGGKTGTTNDVKDLWFAGVTPQVAGAVWVGKQEGGALPRSAYSGDVAAPIWQEAAADALSGRAPTAFAQPDGIGFRWVRGVQMAFAGEATDEPAPGLSRWFGGRGRRRDAPQAAPSEPAPDETPAQPDVTQEEPQDVPDQTDPNQTNPGQTDPGQIDPNQDVPDQTDSSQTDPGQADPNQDNPDQSTSDQGDAVPAPQDDPSADPSFDSPPTNELSAPDTFGQDRPDQGQTDQNQPDQSLPPDDQQNFQGFPGDPSGAAPSDPPFGLAPPPSP